MKQKILALCTAITCAMSAHAQTAHYYLSTNRNEVARSVKALSDGTSIIAGYIYDIDSNNNDLINADNILLRVDPMGNIMWQKQWGTTDNDFLYEMIITQNQDIVVVGTAGRGTIYQNNHAAIYRFDINGNLLAQAFVSDSNANTGGELFNGVCETASGDLIAVGAHDYQPAAVDAFISAFTGNLINVYNETVPLSNNQSDVFTNVVAEGDSVYILGYMYTSTPSTTYYDQVVLRFDPYTGPLGTINWMNYYDISFTVKNDDGSQTILDNDWPVKIFQKNDKLIVSGLDNDGWNAAKGNKHYIFRCDKSNGGNPLLRVVSNGTTSAPYANSSMIIPIDEDDMFISNVPGGQSYDYDQTGIVSGMDFWASHVSSLSSKTVSVSTDFALYNNESVQSLDLGNGGGNLTGYLFMAGNAQNYNSPDNDIYFGISHPSLRDSTAACTHDTATVLDSVFTEPINYTAPQHSVTLGEPVIDSFYTINLVSNIQCGIGLNNKPSKTSITSNSTIADRFIISPNPASSQFDVSYTISRSFTKAEIIITDITGRVIMPGTQLYSKSGMVQMKLADNVQSGFVFCALIIDGKAETVKKVVIIQ